MVRFISDRRLMHLGICVPNPDIRGSRPTPISVGRAYLAVGMPRTASSIAAVSSIKNLGRRAPFTEM